MHGLGALSAHSIYLSSAGRKEGIARCAKKTPGRSLHTGDFVFVMLSIWSNFSAATKRRKLRFDLNERRDYGLSDE